MAVITPIYLSRELTYRANRTGFTYADGSRVRSKPFYWAATVAGTAGDTIGLMYLPPQSTLLMLSSYFQWTGFTSGATVTLGWDEYISTAGVVTVGSAAGLLGALTITTASMWAQGMWLDATVDDFKPAVSEKTFDNRNEVLIYATIGAQVPSVTAVIYGRLFYVTP